MLRTDDAGRWTMDDGRWTMDDGHRTMDAGPSTPYYKLTGELKTFTKTLENVTEIDCNFQYNMSVIFFVFYMHSFMIFIDFSLIWMWQAIYTY